MRKTTRLLELVRAPRLLVMPAAYDALSASLVQEVGFSAVQCSGLGISAASGRPDYSVMGLAEMVEATRNIARAVDLPVMADGDTGYGNAVNTWYTVREFEAAGAAGLNLEDQSFPKRCGKVAGKSLIDAEEMVQKVRAAVDARVDADFVINARTDALSLFGVDEAISRANAYLRAGATMAYVTGVKNAGQIEALVDGLRGPLAISMVEDGLPLGGLTFTQIEQLGVARVSLPTSLVLSAIHGMRHALRCIGQWDATRVDADVFAPFDELHRLAGMPATQALEARFSH